jgi:hypothetical protein
VTHPPLSPADLAALRALCEKATKPPWMEGTAGQTGVVHYDGDDVTHVATCHPDNAAFIAASRTALPRLLDELESARRERDEARELLGKTLDALDENHNPDTCGLSQKQWDQVLDEIRAFLGTEKA